MIFLGRGERELSLGKVINFVYKRFMDHGKVGNWSLGIAFIFIPSGRRLLFRHVIFAEILRMFMKEEIYLRINVCKTEKSSQLLKYVSEAKILRTYRIIFDFRKAIPHDQYTEIVPTLSKILVREKKKGKASGERRKVGNYNSIRQKYEKNKESCKFQ